VLVTVVLLGITVIITNATWYQVVTTRRPTNLSKRAVKRVFIAQMASKDNALLEAINHILVQKDQ